MGAKNFFSHLNELVKRGEGALWGRGWEWGLGGGV